MAREVASCVRQRPPAPRKVGRPEDAERPAPQSARTRFEDLSVSWKEAMSPLATVKEGFEAAIVLMFDFAMERESCLSGRLQDIGEVVELAMHALILESETRHLERRATSICHVMKECLLTCDCDRSRCDSMYVASRQQ